MKNNYIYVPGLSESVADEVKKEKDAEAPRFITGTGAVKKEAVTHDRGILRTRKVDDRQSIQIPVWEKYALTVKEAAEYYNIAETKLRDYLLANRDAPFVLKGGARLCLHRPAEHRRPDFCPGGPRSDPLHAFPPLQGGHPAFQ